MILSIIIPFYNTHRHFTELGFLLSSQLREGVEVIVIDDGSTIPLEKEDWFTLIRQENKGASSARNRGLEVAKGDYVCFIDSDDLVAEDYIDTILGKIENEKFDYCYLSWRTIGNGWRTHVLLKNINDTFPPFNLCVWNRVYKRSAIGDIRFNEKKKIAEDAEFIRQVDEAHLKKSFVDKYLYFYRSDSEDSLTKRFAKGQVESKRIVYHIPKVTKDMGYLIEEFREADKDAEVILMTYENQIPELKEFAMILQPQRMNGTELRGEPTRFFQQIELPIKSDIVIWTAVTFDIGGIETWIYNFCQAMKDRYNIVVLYDKIGTNQLNRLSKIVTVVKNSKRKITTDTVIVSRITDVVPSNVEYKKKVQMVHACKMMPQWSIPQDADTIVTVSDVVKDSFDEQKAVTINNLVPKPKPEKVLLLATASRLSTFEKGMKRMSDFAELLKNNGIKFIWFIFSDVRPQRMIDGMVHLGTKTDVLDYVNKADYLVQLSDAEGFCYSIVEALSMGKPVITTPIDVLEEIGYKDKEHGYIVPFDIKTDTDIKRILDIPKVRYTYDNESRVKQWHRILE